MRLSNQKTDTSGGNQMKTFTSPVDGCQFLYQIEDGNLSYKIDGLDWADFCPQDRRAYADYEYKEFMSLLP